MAGKVGDISKAITEALSEYADAKIEQFEEAIDRATAQAVKDIKANAPKEEGSYRRGWRRRKLSKTNIIIYNEKVPQLTYLLEHGHVKKNQYGEYGRSRKYPHLKPAERAAVDNVLKEVRSDPDIKFKDTKIDV